MAVFVDAARSQRVIGRITSLPALGAALVTVTLLAAGPLQGIDRALDRPWSQQVQLGWHRFFVHVVDRVASREVALPVLAVVAALLAWRLRRWRPLVVAFAAVLADKALIAVMKVFLARSAPYTGGPAFFQGGLFQEGVDGVIYPSGHAADAVLVYGLAVYLIACYGRASRSSVVPLCWGVAALTVITMATSLYLRFHWATDLVAGAIAGGLVLRAAIRVDQSVPEKRREPRMRLATFPDREYVPREPVPVATAYVTPRILASRSFRGAATGRSLAGYVPSGVAGPAEMSRRRTLMWRLRAG